MAGRAFVTFRTQSGAQKFVEDLDYSWLSQVLELIRTKIFRLERRHKLFKGKYLDAKRAPEPSDIYWENLDTPLCQKIMLRGLTLLCTCLVLFIAFGINYAVYEIQVCMYIYIYIYITSSYGSWIILTDMRLLITYLQDYPHLLLLVSILHLYGQLERHLCIYST